MLIVMRTTLVLEQHLYREARKRAADRHSTLSEMVNEGLRLLLSQPVKPRKKVRLVVVGDPSKPVALTPARVRALLDTDGGR